jgi:hypothetical protein
LAARADAVKVGRCSSLTAYSGLDRPHLDGGEHDAKLRACRMDLGHTATSLALLQLPCAPRQGVARCAARTTEHERVCHFAAPDLQAPLQRAQQTVRITSGICFLQPFEQLTTRRCGIGVEPRTQLIRDGGKRVRAAPAALCFRLRLRRWVNLAVPPRRAQAQDECVDRHRLLRCQPGDARLFRRVGKRDQRLLGAADLGQQSDRIEIGTQRNDALPRGLGDARIGQQPIARRQRLVVALRHTRAVTRLLGELEGRLECIHEQSHRRISPNTSTNNVCSRTSSGASSVQPDAISVTTSVCTNAPFVTGPECARRLPFPLLGFDVDNDSVFMNETVRDYCAAEKIELTRCRPYRKNDQAHVEQKNGEIVRRMVGYRRYEGIAAAEQLARLYAPCPWRTIASINVGMIAFSRLPQTRSDASHLALAPEVRRGLLEMSAATIDRALQPQRERCSTRRRRPSSVSTIRRSIPVRTFADWRDPPPGFVEADLVVETPAKGKTAKKTDETKTPKAKKKTA